MKNILILYNPYYQNNVMEQHIKILKDKGSVAFGKIKSVLRDYKHPNEDILNEIYNDVSKSNPMQLFLTDYNSIYVANVLAVKTEKTKFIKAPKYYNELDVEKWYIIDDIRIIVNNDFQLLRDSVLSNFQAVNYNNRTYTVYGNKYVYPMQITMKKNIHYFDKEEESFKYFTNIFKSEQEIDIRNSLINYCFSKKIFYSFAPNSQDNLIGAEIEYLQNKHNPLYDFSSVVMKYSKIIELELYEFIKYLFNYLIFKTSSIKNIGYSVQGQDYILNDIFTYKVNYGTYKYLLKNDKINKSINNHIESNKIRYFITDNIIKFIPTMQKIRNESVHGNTTAINECEKLREYIFGIGKNGFLKDIKVYGEEIKNLNLQN